MMESEDFVTMESLFEVSLVESGQEINIPDEIEEVVIDDPVTEVAPSQDTRTKSLSCVADIIGKCQGVSIIRAEAVGDKTKSPCLSAVNGNAARDKTKSPCLSAVNGNAAGDKTKPASSSVVNCAAVEDEKKPAGWSAVNGDVATDLPKPASLSSVNVNASSISEEEKMFYKEMFKEPFAVANVRLHCTACDRHLGMSAKTVVFSHRILRVLLCQKCYLFYGSGDFLQGEDGSDMFCRWCGQGGRLLCCSLCSNVFCEKCISRNFGNTELRKIKRADDWFCFACNLKCLWPARATCASLKNAVTELKRKSAQVKAKEGRASFCVDQSKCCSSEIPTVRPSKAKGSVTSEEQKKPLAMIQPLPKKKVLTPAHVWNVPEVSEQRPGYITVSAEKTLRESPCLLPQILREPPSLPSPLPLQFMSRDQLTSRIQTSQGSLPSPLISSKFDCSRKYERVKYVNPAHKSIMPVRMTPGVGVPQYCNTYSPAQATPSPRTIDTFSSATNSQRSVIRHKFMKIVSTGQSTPTHVNQQQQQFAQIQTTPTVQQQQQQQQQQQMAGILPAQQHVGILPSHQVVEQPTLQLPNPRLLAPNQVYTIPRSYINKIVKGRLGHTEIPAHVFKPTGIPMCPPSLPIPQVNKTNNFAMSQQPVDVNKVKSKWFVSSIEKYSGVSCVLWSHVYKLKQTFANMEAKNNVRGMKITAAKLHHLLETAAEHMKDIDRMLGREFSNWCKSLKTPPQQLNAAPPEVIDITNDDDHPITLMDNTSAEVIEVEISPDIISLGRFSSSADDIRYDGESSDTCVSPAKTKTSKDSNSEKNVHQASVVNVQSTMLDHVNSSSEPVRTGKIPDESDVTLDLDICCESDEDDRDGDENTTDQNQVLKCDYKDVWDAVEYDRDSSFYEKLSEVMNNKQVPCVKLGEGMSLNEVTGEIEPDYDCLSQTSPKANHKSVLSSLLRRKTTMTQTDSTNEKSTMQFPKKCNITVQTEVNVDKWNLKKSEKIKCKCIAVQTESVNEMESQEPVKPWSNEFDSFLKKLDRSTDADDDPLRIPEPVTAPMLPTSKQSGRCLPQQLAAAEEIAEHTDKVQRLNDVSLVRKCIVMLDKVKFPSHSSVSSNTLAGVRLRVKKEKLDYIDTNRAVSKILRSERRKSLLDSRNLPAPESVKRKRLMKTPVSVDFVHKVKKIKREFNLATKYPKMAGKKCIVKVEKLEKK